MFHQHSTIFEAVKNGYPDVAANEMAKHLTELWASIERMTLDESSFSE
jgi:DNA-binding GntR family transcriptional regulator